MNEYEWLVANDPGPMLQHLALRPTLNTYSNRKFRLFACACLRYSWRGLTAPGSRENVILAEEVADNERKPFPTLVEDISSPDHMAICGWSAMEAAQYGSVYSGNLFTDRSTQAALLREVAGNQWRPVLVGTDDRGSYQFFPDLHLADRLMYSTINWHTQRVQDLARAAYDERLENGALDPERLLVLADALEEAGCPVEWCDTCNGKGEYQSLVVEGAVISWGCGLCGGRMEVRGTGRTPGNPHPLLKHLRGECSNCDGKGWYRVLRVGWLDCKACGGSGRSAIPHYRGCWAVDALLGKW